ncbi:MAG TPA: hypothetical protein VF376_12765, partial [Thermoanaerobaculia bacterium]
FLLDRTILPLDHIGQIHPWVEIGAAPAYNPYLNDVVTQILPWNKAVRLAWKDRELPWRDRWNGCGMPLAANAVSAAFSPLTLLGLLFPMARGYTLICALKLLLAGTGAWLWLRELGVSRSACAFSSAAFALSFSFTPPWLLFPQSAVLCLWPWILFLIERLGDQTHSLRVTLATAAVLVFIELAGHPETAVVIFAFTGVWLAARWIMGDLRRPVRLMMSLALASAVALGLTAFLWIPTLYAIAASGPLRAVARPFWEPVVSLVPHLPIWSGSMTSFFPHALGNAIDVPRIDGGGISFPEMTLGYFGIVGWSCALLIFRPGSPRPKAEWILLALVVSGWGMSVGLWPFAEISARTPVIRFLFPPRFHSWEAMAGSAIAGFELDRLIKDVARGGGRRLQSAIGILAIPAGAGIFLFLRLRRQYSTHRALVFEQRQLALLLAVLGLAALLLWNLRRRPRLALVGLTVLSAGELLVEWRGLFRLGRPEWLFPPTPAIRFLRDQTGPFRIAGDGSPFFPSTNVFAGLEEIRTHDAVERRDYMDFLDRTCGYRYQYFKVIDNLDCPALDLLNVRYVAAVPGKGAPGPRWKSVYSGRDAELYENTRVLPRAFAPRRVRLVRPGAPSSLADGNAAFGPRFLEQAASVGDWRETAFVLSSHTDEIENGAVAVSEYRETTNTVSFRARVPGAAAGYVVLSLVQDGGWTVRGDSLRLVRANGPFIAVFIPPGDRRVRLTYTPPGLPQGASLTLLTLLTAAMAGAIWALRSRSFFLRAAKRGVCSA